MNRIFYTFLISALMLLPGVTWAQQDHFGAGNDQGIKVSSSDQYSYANWSREASGEKTIDGSGLDGPAIEMSRFLSQATLGFSLEELEEATEIGMESWLENQFALPHHSMVELLEETNSEVFEWFLMNGNDSSDYFGPSWLHLNYSWWTRHMTGEDLLRQKVALALSEILVISINSELGGYGWGLASYYDIFMRHAFGNYKDILTDVSLHPCMGFYLSHLNNPRSIPSENIHPDENYAREIMQLFSVGLYMLNQDGTRVLDGQGQPIPTYDQDDIRELAKVFTGLGLSEVMPNMYFDTAQFGLGIYFGDLTKPMKMYPIWHEPGTKTLLDGHVIPNGQDPMKDVSDAIQHIFDHPNVGPFIGRQLIQRLVKSNPSPEYISRVAAAFNDNGAGIRGDMKAVISAILLDEEARDCIWLSDEQSARLREPLVRYTHFAKAIPSEQIYGRYWNAGYDFWDATGQIVMGAPSVFNFFLPDFQPVGEIGAQGLYGPEYQIHNTKTTVGYMNSANSWAVYRNVLYGWETGNPPVVTNLDALKEFAVDPESLVNELDKILTHGQMTDRSRQIIKDAIEPIIWGDYRIDRVRLALYLTMISPDYNIQR